MLKRILIILIYIVPFIILVKPILDGAIPFWHDPARDLLMAWDNLNKISLIGPTSGIPGIFYGPHWIWLLSIGLVISKDPRVVAFLIMAVPYFIGIPLSLYLLNKSLISRTSVLTAWIIIVFGFSSYISQIWSPNLAALFYLLLLTVFYKTRDIRSGNNFGRFLLMGLLFGLLFNHHISIGVVLLATWIFYFIFVFLQILFKKTIIKKLLTHWFVNTAGFWTGFFIMLSPFLIFELRHGFMQIKSLLFTLSKPTAVVGLVGLSKLEIIKKFLERSSIALSIPTQFSILVIALIIFLIIKNLYKKVYTKDDIKLLTLLFLNTFSLFIVYFGTKNPVWSYHFISVEVIFIFLILLAIKKNFIWEKLLLSWAIILLIVHIISFGKSFTKQKNPGELMAKKSNVEFILKDTGNLSFAYLAKNPSIYSYDYDYLFRWLGGDSKQNPSLNLEEAKNIYVIVPYEMRNDKVGFTLNRTPGDKYYTSEEWMRPDKTIIIKRLHK